jgi:membrane protease YdiL (CAAX protease family)
MSLKNAKFFITGALISSSVLLICLRLVAQFQLKLNDVSLLSQLVIVIIALATAIFEEITFRYYLINYLKGLTKYVSVHILISSIIFAFFHLGNLNVSSFAIFSHFIGGIVYAFAYILSRRLSLAIGLHFGWNYVQMALSLPISGRQKEGWFTIHLPFDDQLYGSLYGIEDGWVSILFRVMILTICFLLFYKTYIRGISLG